MIGIKEISKMRSLLQKLILLSVLTYVVPTSAYGSTIFLTTESKKISVGDTVVVSVMLNTEDVLTNAVEGSIVFDSKDVNYTVDVSDAGSKLSIWPTKPTYNQVGHIITFVGGEPLGFTSKSAKLFDIIITPQKAGNITLKPSNFLSYRNDGKGTVDKSSVSSFTLSVEQLGSGEQNHNEWKDVVAADKTSPEEFIIESGSDPSVFDGKKFITFHTKDLESGIDHYEVIEGDLPAVRSDGQYVLLNQNANQKITVIAYDKAGNNRVVVFNYENMQTSSKQIFFGVFLAILLMGIIVLYRKQKNN